MKIPEGFVLRHIGENWIVVPVGAQTVDFRCIINLNETGAFLWEHLQSECTAEELTALLLEEYEVSPERAAEDVNAFIERLRQAKLLA